MGPRRRSRATCRRRFGEERPRQGEARGSRRRKATAGGQAQAALRLREDGSAKIQIPELRANHLPLGKNRRAHGEVVFPNRSCRRGPEAESFNRRAESLAEGRCRFTAGLNAKGP